MSNQKKSKGWPELGQIVKNVVQTKDDNGNWVDVLDSNGKQQFKLSFKVAEGITILHEGQPVSLNKGRTGIMKSPVEEVEGLYKAGQIDEESIEFRREKAKEATWLRYKIQLPPPRD